MRRTRRSQQGAIRMPNELLTFYWQLRSRYAQAVRCGDCSRSICARKTSATRRCPRDLRGGPRAKGAVGALHELGSSEASAKVFVDGWLSAATGLDRTIRLNPGTHSIHITDGRYASSLRELRVEPGGREAYTIALQPHTPTPPPAMAVTPSGVSPAEAAQNDRKPFVLRAVRHST
jgi:hypothetical protein